VSRRAEEFGLEKLPPGSITPTGLRLPATMPFEEWAEVGPGLSRIGRSIVWAIGDWLNYGEVKFGEKYSQAASDTGYDPGYLASLAWVSRAVEPSRRREKLGWSHHQAVAGLEAEQQTEWLLRAEQKGWTRAELRDQLASKRKKKLKNMDDGEKPSAEWWRLTMRLVGKRNRKDVERALTRGLEVYGVDTHPLVVARWAGEALARWAKEAKA
jgi:hypothetical protein